MDFKKLISTRNKRLYNGLLILFFTAILFFITIHKLETNKLSLRIGDIAPSTIRSTKELEDKHITEKLKAEAMNKIEPIYRISPSIQMVMKNNIKDFLDTTRDIKAQDSISFNKKAELLLENQSLGLESKEVSIALKMDYKALNSFENILWDLINQVMGNGIKETELEYEKENLVKTFDSLDMKKEEKELGLALFNATINSNEFLDKTETQRKKEEAANKIETVIINEDEIIAFQGSVITERELHLIDEAGLLKGDNNLPISMIIGIILLLLLGLSIIIGYIYFFNKEILYNNRLLIMLIIVILTIIISKALYSLSPYIMPVAAASLLISMLIDPKLALLVNIFLSFYLGFVLKLDNSIVIMHIVSGSIGAIIAIRQEQRHYILLNGLIIGVINLLTLGAVGLAEGSRGINSFLEGNYSLLNGIIAAMITLGSLPIWENIFSVLTPLKLLELSNPNQPLLKKLLLEAPGTYHHSILVGNLSEAAAEAISANPLITRVGSYYHDIGKTIRPYYFAENQFGMENPHNKLQPMQSTAIITSHTTDGIVLGKEGKLPKEILDIIDQHHGDTPVAYFYYKAKELDNDINMSMDEFRYKGKKPQTKEAAIVMLADSSEAAVRSIKDLTKEKIEDMVRKVVEGKVKDGQLDECNVTLKEIEIIIKSFINVLTGIYHDRIEYPNIEIKSEASE
ncbi:HDIG domain-containing metalloprotein [Tissierella sp.]|uniref:HD family phosphohydrolase n=1 Tax=Tissierella sp. TaxID=41274 RepID=UPI002855C6D8|nr:HDIG domain-containing metalloprotein [Tissierella sp.]MDR7857121.1 HDIG domain-containing protein [Tissierella sp.]